MMNQSLLKMSSLIKTLEITCNNDELIKQEIETNRDLQSKEKLLNKTIIEQDRLKKNEESKKKHFEKINQEYLEKVDELNKGKIEKLNEELNSSFLEYNNQMFLKTQKKKEEIEYNIKMQIEKDKKLEVENDQKKNEILMEMENLINETQNQDVKLDLQRMLLEAKNNLKLWEIQAKKRRDEEIEKDKLEREKLLQEKKNKIRKSVQKPENIIIQPTLIVKLSPSTSATSPDAPITLKYLYELGEPSDKDFITFQPMFQNSDQNVLIKINQKEGEIQITAPKNIGLYEFQFLRDEQKLFVSTPISIGKAVTISLREENNQIIAKVTPLYDIKNISSWDSLGLFPQVTQSNKHSCLEWKYYKTNELSFKKPRKPGNYVVKFMPYGYNWLETSISNAFVVEDKDYFNCETIVKLGEFLSIKWRFLSVDMSNGDWISICTINSDKYFDYKETRSVESEHSMNFPIKNNFLPGTYKINFNAKASSSNPIKTFGPIEILPRDDDKNATLDRKIFVTATVLYPFTNFPFDGEIPKYFLNANPGDKISFIQKVDEFYCSGRLNDQKGYYPIQGYVEHSVNYQSYFEYLKLLKGSLFIFVGNQKQNHIFSNFMGFSISSFFNELQSHFKHKKTFKFNEYSCSYTGSNVGDDSVGQIKEDDTLFYYLCYSNENWDKDTDSIFFFCYQSTTKDPIDSCSEWYLSQTLRQLESCSNSFTLAHRFVKDQEEPFF